MPELTPVDDSQFVILKRLGLVPVMAGCKACEHKFFTPSNLSMNAVEAGAYLRRKFEEHQCSSRRDDWEGRFQF